MSPRRSESEISMTLKEPQYHYSVMKWNGQQFQGDMIRKPEKSVRQTIDTQKMYQVAESLLNLYIGMMNI